MPSTSPNENDVEERSDQGSDPGSDDDLSSLGSHELDGLKEDDLEEDDLEEELEQTQVKPSPKRRKTKPAQDPPNKEEMCEDEPLYQLWNSVGHPMMELVTDATSDNSEFATKVQRDEALALLIKKACVNMSPEMRTLLMQSLMGEPTDCHALTLQVSDTLVLSTRPPPVSQRFLDTLAIFGTCIEEATARLQTGPAVLRQFDLAVNVTEANNVHELLYGIMQFIRKLFFDYYTERLLKAHTQMWEVMAVALQMFLVNHISVLGVDLSPEEARTVLNTVRKSPEIWVLFAGIDTPEQQEFKNLGEREQVERVVMTAGQIFCLVLQARKTKQQIQEMKTELNMYQRSGVLAGREELKAEFGPKIKEALDELTARQRQLDAMIRAVRLDEGASNPTNLKAVPLLAKLKESGVYTVKRRKPTVVCEHNVTALSCDSCHPCKKHPDQRKNWRTCPACLEPKQVVAQIGQVEQVVEQVEPDVQKPTKIPPKETARDTEKVIFCREFETCGYLGAPELKNGVRQILKEFDNTVTSARTPERIERRGYVWKEYQRFCSVVIGQSGPHLATHELDTAYIIQQIPAFLNEHDFTEADLLSSHRLYLNLLLVLFLQHQMRLRLEIPLSEESRALVFTKIELYVTSWYVGKRHRPSYFALMWPQLNYPVEMYAAVYEVFDLGHMAARRVALVKEAVKAIKANVNFDFNKITTPQITPFVNVIGEGDVFHKEVEQSAARFIFKTATDATDAGTNLTVIPFIQADTFESDLPTKVATLYSTNPELFVGSRFTREFASHLPGFCIWQNVDNIPEPTMTTIQELYHEVRQTEMRGASEVNASHVKDWWKSAGLALLSHNLKPDFAACCEAFLKEFAFRRFTEEDVDNVKKHMSTTYHSIVQDINDDLAAGRGNTWVVKDRTTAMGAMKTNEQALLFVRNCCALWSEENNPGVATESVPKKLKKSKKSEEAAEAEEAEEDEEDPIYVLPSFVSRASSQADFARVVAALAIFNRDEHPGKHPEKSSYTLTAATHCIKTQLVYKGARSGKNGKKVINLNRGELADEACEVKQPESHCFLSALVYTPVDRVPEEGQKWAASDYNQLPSVIYTAYFICAIMLAVGREIPATADKFHPLKKFIATTLERLKNSYVRGTSKTKHSSHVMIPSLVHIGKCQSASLPQLVSHILDRAKAAFDSFESPMTRDNLTELAIKLIPVVIHRLESIEAAQPAAVFEEQLRIQKLTIVHQKKRTTPAVKKGNPNKTRPDKTAGSSDTPDVVLQEGQVVSNNRNRDAMDDFLAVTDSPVPDDDLHQQLLEFSCVFLANDAAQTDTSGVAQTDTSGVAHTDTSGVAHTDTSGVAHTDTDGHPMDVDDLLH